MRAKGNGSGLRASKSHRRRPIGIKMAERHLGDEGRTVSWKRRLLDAAHRIGVLDLLGRSFGRRRLTVLAYHRVTEVATDGFDTYRRNVSATPEDFDVQMAMVARRFNPVSISDVLGWLDGGPRLPERPLVVTFDDGYRDNLDRALPILERYRIPMTILLATGHIGTEMPLWWDLAAWCFAHSERTEADLPGLGKRRWSGVAERERVLGEWLEALKLRSDGERAGAIASLPALLGVEPPPGAFSEVYLTWDEVRRMQARGVAFGAHTLTHPILTRVGPERAREEIFGSKAAVEEILGTPSPAFAYPNGGRGDVDETVRGLVADAGFRLGFTLLPGPSRLEEVRKDPLMVRRVYVHHRDLPARFAAGTAGWLRIREAAGALGR